MISIRRYKYLIDQLKQFTSLENKVTVDCSCGRGDGTKCLDKEGCKVVGIDIHSGRIRDAKTAFPELDFRLGSLLDTRLPDNYADVFVCSETLEHITREESLKSAAEINRVCKSLSYICITVPYDKKVCLANRSHKQYLSHKVITRHFKKWELVSDTIFYRAPRMKKQKRGCKVFVFKRS